MTLLVKFKHIWTGVEYGIFDEGLGTYTVLAWLPGGTDVGVEVARANVTDDGKGDYLTSVRVEKKHRRRGVATALYRAIELHIGRPLRPSPRYVSPDAEAFWAARKRSEQLGRDPSKNLRPLFFSQKISITPGALKALESAGDDPRLLLDRHFFGDWGDIDVHDWAANDAALWEEGMILSSYLTRAGLKIWVITDPGHETTTILLPEER